MTVIERIFPVYVDLIPSILEDGHLYISLKYQTAVHRCCCGCGNRVVTPLKAGGWEPVDEGVGPSLIPSIGNWNFPCRSHYWIQLGKVDWSVQLSPAQIEWNRKRDQDDAVFAADVSNEEHVRSGRNASVWSRMWRGVARWFTRRS